MESGPESHLKVEQTTVHLYAVEELWALNIGYMILFKMPLKSIRNKTTLKVW